MEGTKVGSYEIKSLLGKGGMGEVYLAEHTLLKRPVAIKFLLPSLSADEEVVERFFNEARATSAIADPGIVQVFDFGYHIDGSAYIVMEYLVGETLDHRIEGDGPIAPLAALRLTRHLANALAKAHASGVIHRDLKLENVFLVQDPAVPGGERPKILDFGIAKLAQPEQGRSVTRTGAIMGTPIYMSPEQCKGAHQVDERSDLYSLGCVLYSMVIGRPPFDYDSAGEIIAAHLREEPPVPSRMRSELPPEFDSIMARCLAKDPAARYQSMAELAAAITTVLDDEVAASRPGTERGTQARRQVSNPVGPSSLAKPTTLSSATNSTAADLAPSPRRPGRWIAAGFGLVAIAAVAFVAVRMSRGSGTRPAAAPPVVAPAPAPSIAAPAIVAPPPAPPPVAPAPVDPPPVDPPPVDTPPVDVAVDPVEPPVVAGDKKPGGKKPGGKKPGDGKGTGAAAGNAAETMDRGD